MAPSLSENISIVFDDFRRYFPGDMIRGHVSVCPRHTTRTESILVRFAGTIDISSFGGQLETLTLFDQTKHLRSPRDRTLEFVLHENMTYKFQFAFMIPDDLELPSELEHRNRTSIQYIVTATQNQHCVPIHQCPRAEFRVPVYEFINIESTSYRMPQENTAQIRATGAHISVAITRTGFPIGAIIPVKSKLSNFGHNRITQSLEVSLVRTTEVRRERHGYTDEEVIHQVRHTLDIRNQDPLVVTSYLQIPEFACPTTKYNGLMLQVHYQVIVVAKLHSSRHDTIDIHLPIVVGTWPSNAIMDNPQSNSNTTLASDRRNRTLFSADLRPNSIFGLPFSFRQPRPSSDHTLSNMQERSPHDVSERSVPSRPVELVPLSPVNSVVSHGSDTSTLVHDFLPQATYRTASRSMPSLHFSADEFGTSLSSDSEDDDESHRSLRVYDYGTYLIAR